MKTTKDIKTKSDEWVYSDVVKEHFFNPRNVLKNEENYQADGVGIVGSPACGDVMKVWIKVDPVTKKIMECKWKTFGCASAVASTSMLSVMVTENGGMLVDDAYKLRSKDILEQLGGLPDNKIHCSVLGDQALRAAIDDYRRRETHA
jgi:NifU-like protein